jgi:FkbM family methyltransferase
MGFARSFLWRASRAAYMWARDELRDNTHVTVEERELQRRLAELGGPGNSLTVIDVGANSGDWSVAMIAAAGARPALHLDLHAFEPVAGAFAVLERAVPPSSARLSVTLNNVGLSSREGEMVMHVTQAAAATNSLYQAEVPGLTSPSSVRLTTVDAYVRDRKLAHVDLLKVDTEGHDLAVLEGARGALARGAVGLVQFEYNDRWIASRHFLKDAFDLMQGLGVDYFIGKVTRHGIVLYEGWHRELDRFFEANYVMVRGDLTASLGARIGRFDHANVLVTR